MKEITKAIILAAGLGTRFLPATKACPKEMLPIVDKPTIQYIIEEALASGIKDILIISGHNKRAIEDHFDRNPELEVNLKEHGKTELLEQVKAIADVNVLLGDDVVYNDENPCLKQLIDIYNATGSSVLGCQTVPQEKVSSYGIVASEATDNERIFKVNDMAEKPAISEAPSRLAVLGRYVITPEIFTILEQTAPGRGGEIQLTDALKVLAKQQNMYAYDFVGRRYDVGDKEGYLEATVEYALRRENLKDKFLEYLGRVVG